MLDGQRTYQREVFDLPEDLESNVHYNPLTFGGDRIAFTCLYNP